MKWDTGREGRTDSRQVQSEALGARIGRTDASTWLQPAMAKQIAENVLGKVEMGRIVRRLDEARHQPIQASAQSGGVWQAQSGGEQTPRQARSLSLPQRSGHADQVSKDLYGLGGQFAARSLVLHQQSNAS